MSHLQLRRLGAAALATAAVAAVAAPAAQAAPVNLAGATTTLALSDAAQATLTQAGVTVTPVAPATSPLAGSYSFPVVRGKLAAERHLGFAVHKGGLTLSTSAKHVTVRRLIAFGGRRPLVTARVGRAQVALLRLTQVKLGDGALLSGKASLTRVGARLLGRFLGTDGFTAGTPVGTVTVTAATSATSV
jgi:hypothetical protein